MLFALPLSARLNKVIRLDITNEALLDQAIVTDLNSNTSALFSSASTYGEEEIESMLGYIDENATVHATWPKIQREAAEIEDAKTNRLKCSFAIVLQPFGLLFLGRQNFESIKALVIAPRPEFELGQLYWAGSK